MEPQALGEFRIEGKLGQGAMGAVYRAHQTSLNRTVALKVLPPHAALDPDFIARFKQEAQAAAALNHPHIVQIYAAGDSDGTHFFAMEYVDGETLGTRVERKGRLDPREAVAVAVYVARALDYAWKRARIIHRDIKPDNIFLSREGEVKLGDLGLAKALDAQAVGATQTGTSMGTPYYVSPEQARGDRNVDFRADIYSLGCTLFHILSGVTPYQGDSAMGVMLQHLTQPPPAIQQVWPECPLPIIGLLERMLRKDPGARHQSYEELIEDLLWVSAKLDEPNAIAAPATSMIVPRPKATATEPAASASAARSATAPPTATGKGALYATIAGAVVLLAAGALLWAPLKKPPVHTAEAPLPATPAPAIVAAAPRVEPEPAKAAEVPVAPPLSSATAKSPSDAVASSPDGVTFNPASAGWTDLFTGRDVSQWRGSKQDTFPDGAWAIENGALRNIHGQNDQNLETRETFRDFELDFEWKISAGGNSGILFGGREFQIADDVSNANGKIPATSCGSLCYVIAPSSRKQLKPAGEYNRGQLIVNGSHVEHWINGERVVDYELGSPALKSLVASGQFKNLPGYSVANTEPSETHIGLQSHVGNAWFRNVRIRKLEPAQIASSTPAPQANSAEGFAESEFTSLFNGKDFTGWRGGDSFDHRMFRAMSASDQAAQIAKWTRAMFEVDPVTRKPHWRIESGEFVNDGSGGFATTEKDYGDFELRLEYRTVPKADSGIYLRGVPQVQIWDYTDSSKFKIGANKGSGGLWNNSPGASGKDPLVIADKPFGEWNNLRIQMVGPRVSVWLNDKMVVEDAVLENSFDRTKPIPDRGPIQLQTRGGEIRWRNIRIREIGNPASAASVNRTPAPMVAAAPQTMVLARKPAPQFSGALMATIWVMRDSFGDVYYLEFAQGGVLNYEGQRGFRPNGKWRQEGLAVSIEINDGVAKLTGTLSGRQMRGNASSTTAGHWTWEATPRQ